MLRLCIFLTGYLALGIHGYAVFTLTISENLISGGTNWRFSEASGTLSSQGSSHFLVGSTVANPQNFYAADAQDQSLAVLAGNNALGIARIFTRNYGGLSGSNGDIFDGLDFQTDATIDGLSLSGMNGLVLHADQFSFSNLNEGVYSLDSYYDGSGYNTSLGAVTLLVGTVIPEPSGWLLPLLGMGVGVLVKTTRGAGKRPL